MSAALAQLLLGGFGGGDQLGVVAVPGFFNLEEARPVFQQQPALVREMAGQPLHDGRQFGQVAGRAGEREWPGQRHRDGCELRRARLHFLKLVTLVTDAVFQPLNLLEQTGAGFLPVLLVGGQLTLALDDGGLARLHGDAAAARVRGARR